MNPGGPQVPFPQIVCGHGRTGYGRERNKTYPTRKHERLQVVFKKVRRPMSTI